ncbi:MAG: hypothetical protein ACYTG7_11100, partial [Planctomycetota bacterium]
MIRKSLFVLLVLGMGAFAYADSPDEILEAQGLYEGSGVTHAKVGPSPKAARGEAFLMIPDSTSDTVGMFDPNDGTYLGELIPDTGHFSTPINCILGPDGDLYVSDQVADSVFVFDVDGNYLYTYADSTDGLNNIRGIDFRDNNLFITSATEVSEFDGPHSRLPDFITGSTFFDILFLEDGTCLVIDIGTDTMDYYDAAGVFQYTLFPLDFGEQVNFDTELPGEFLTAAFSDQIIHDFELDGTIVESTPLSTYGRGVYRLGNGNLLHSNGSGVFELEPGTGNIIEQKFSGSSRFIELYGEAEPPTLSVDPPEVSAYFGGKFTFTLTGGPDLAGRDYALFGSTSGTSPGTVLPGGLVLPINYDWFTVLLLDLALQGGAGLVIDFIGTLDKAGSAEAQLCFPGHCELFEDVTLYFAWCTYSPFDFVSNSVEALLTGGPQILDEYKYDDVSTENLLTNFGGELCWANYFDVVVGHESLTDAGTLWGSTMWSGYGPGNGVNALLYIWEDTNGDKQLWDGDALVHSQTVVTDEYDNDTHVYYTITGGPLTITTAGFFVGFCLDHGSGQYVFPMDESQNPTNGNTWIISMQLGAVDP